MSVRVLSTCLPPTRDRRVVRLMQFRTPEGAISEAGVRMLEAELTFLAVTVEFMPDDPPGPDAVDQLRAHAKKALAPVSSRLNALAGPDHMVGSSKAIRSLANLAGREVSGLGLDRTVLSRSSLRSWIPRLARIPASARQELPGITPDRTWQIVAVAVCLHAAMKMLDIDELEVSPCALREGGSGI